MSCVWKRIHPTMIMKIRFQVSFDLALDLHTQTLAHTHTRNWLHRGSGMGLQLMKRSPMNRINIECIRCAMELAASNTCYVAVHALLGSSWLSCCLLHHSLRFIVLRSPVFTLCLFYWWLLFHVFLLALYFFSYSLFILYSRPCCSHYSAHVISYAFLLFFFFLFLFLSFLLRLFLLLKFQFRQCVSGFLFSTA